MMRAIRPACGVTVALLALHAPAEARAGLTIYSDPASYLAATAGNTRIDFEGSTPQFLPTPPGITLAGVNFTIDTGASDGFLFVIAPDFYYPGNTVLSSQQSTTAENNFLITLPGSYTAVALSLGSFDGGTAMLTTSAGDSYEVAIPELSGGLAFTGFVSTTPIDSIRVSHSTAVAGVLNLDDIQFGAAVAAVPEPSTLLLVAAGAFGLLAAKRRQA